MGNLNKDVVVKCNTSKLQVTWTQNGEPEPMAELVAEGQTLTILGLDLPATGNYSCWAGGVLLDSTYVVVGDSGTWGSGGCGTTGARGQERGMGRDVRCWAGWADVGRWDGAETDVE